MMEIKAGDVVKFRKGAISDLWNVSQVHRADRSADIWQIVDGRRIERNVSLGELTRVTN